jgi:Cof subfamily protein (haloacid dehalogenase superfamily)
MYTAVPRKIAQMITRGPRRNRRIGSKHIAADASAGGPAAATSPRRAEKYRVVVLDVDGTMVGPDFVVSDRLRRAVRAAQDAGATVSLATGRMMRSARRFALEAGAEGPVICYQGALTFSAQTGEIIRHARISPAAARAALEIFAATDAHVNLYLDDEVYVERLTLWAEGYASRMEIGLKVVRSLSALADRRPTLILAVSDTDRNLTLVPEAARRLGRLARVTHSLPHFCEVGSPQAGKERALAHLSKLLDVPSQQFIAFGDGKGDAGMLRWAGLGVAIEGGHPDAIAAAGQAVQGPDKDGAARMIEELVRQGTIGA